MGGDRDRGEERGDPSRTKGTSNHNVCLVLYVGLSGVSLSLWVVVGYFLIFF
jgi:hypothetical protein